MEIEKADSHSRWRAVLWLVVLSLPLLLLFDQLEAQLEQWREDPAQIEEQLIFIILFLYLLVLPMLIFCGWLWFFARRIIAGQRFPPVGSLVVRDTPVLEGHRAIARGRLLQLLAAILAVLFLFLPLAVYAVLRSLL